MRVNGKEIELKRGMTLAEFLAAHNYRAETGGGGAQRADCAAHGIWCSRFNRRPMNWKL